MGIKEVAERLCKKYQTRDPIEIARQLGIEVMFEQLGTIRGYYNREYHHKMIHINVDLDKRQQRIVCAHELGHAILHPDANTPFLRSSTLISVGRMETEANKFAVDIMWSDEELRAYQDWTIPQIAVRLGISEKIAEYRMLSVIPRINGI